MGASELAPPAGWGSDPGLEERWTGDFSPRPDFRRIESELWRPSFPPKMSAAGLQEGVTGGVALAGPRQTSSSTEEPGSSATGARSLPCFGKICYLNVQGQKMQNEWAAVSDSRNHGIYLTDVGAPTPEPQALFPGSCWEHVAEQNVSQEGHFPVPSQGWTLGGGMERGCSRQPSHGNLVWGRCRLATKQNSSVPKAVEVEGVLVMG